MSTGRVLLRLVVAPGRRGLLLGGLVAVLAAAASVALVASAGWLVTSSAAAGIALAAGAAMTLDIFAPGALIRLLAVTRTVGRYVERLVLHATIFRLVAWLRVRVYTAWARLAWQSLRRQGRAAGLNRLMEDVGALEALHPGLLVPLFALLVTSAGFAAVGGGLAGAGVALAAILLLAVLVATILSPVWAGARQDTRVVVGRERFRVRLVDTLATVNALYFADPGGRVRDDLLRLDARCHRGAHRQAVRAAIGEGLAQYAVVLAAAAVIIVAALAGTKPPAMTTLATLGMLALGGLVAGLPEAWQGFARLWLAAHRLRDELGGTAPAVVPADAPPSTDPAPPGWRLDDIVVSRSATGARVLDGLSLAIEPGEHLCITGVSGAGKSTLLEVLMGLLPPRSGHAWCGDRPLREIGEREMVARATLLTQATVLLSGSVAQNLRIADAALGDDEIRALIGELGLADAVDAGQWIGRHGATLSGGEARRIVLARAVLRRTGALLLDEPFRGLDAPSRIRVAKWLAAEARGRTLVLCDHAAPEGIAFDRVLTLRDGRLHEAGAGLRT